LWILSFFVSKSILLVLTFKCEFFFFLVYVFC
jgi:hypothetical protein